MKKYLFMILMVLSASAMAQTEKGAVLVGGGLTLRTGEGSSQFTFNPTVGYFFSDNFTFGGTVSYSNVKLGAVKSSDFGIGPFARYYFGTASTKPLVVSEFNFLNSTTKQANSNDIKTNGTRFLIGLGFAAFINETVAVEGISGYSYSKFKDFNGSGGFNLSLGFGLYFNRNTAKDLKKNVMGATK